MSTTSSPDRRFIVALTAAVASATLAIGATTAALLGWVGPSTEPSASSPPAAAGSGSAQLVYVPITPATPPPPPSIEPSTAGEPRLTMAEANAHSDDRVDRGDRDDRGDDEEHDDD